MFDTSKLGHTTKQNNSIILTKNASTSNIENNSKSDKEEIEFNKADSIDNDNIEENNFIYNHLNINVLDKPSFIKEILMQLVLENQEYEKLPIEYSSKCNRRSSTEKAKYARLNSEYYALLKKIEDLTDIIKNFFRYRKVEKLVKITLIKNYYYRNNL
jgi:hypothetical protein